MIALLQRTLTASVSIQGESIAAIERGILVFAAVQKHDDEAIATSMCRRILGYRIFADQNGKMNRNVTEIKGGILVVPQFTLAADTGKGLRPGFSSAAAPAQGKALFAYFLGEIKSKYAKVEAGKFGANMQVHLVNDGPVTFWLQL